MTLNMLAVLIIFLGILTTYVIYKVTGLPITTMVGILSGAVTNTPGLGAAQQAFFDITGKEGTDIAMGYAVAYPLGVIGIIVAIILIRRIFRISFEKENEMLQNEREEKAVRATHVSVLVKNPALFGKEVAEIADLIDRKFVISRVLHENSGIEIAYSRTHLEQGDKLFIIAA